MASTGMDDTKERLEPLKLGGTKEKLEHLLDEYEELQKIYREIEFEIYLGEVRSKYYSFNLIQLNNPYIGPGPASFLTEAKYLFGLRFGKLKNDIIRLEKKLEEGKKTLGQFDIISGNIFSLMKSYLKGNSTDVGLTINGISKSIEEQTLAILSIRTEYNLEKVSELIWRGRYIYLTSMKETEKKKDMATATFQSASASSEYHNKKQILEEAFRASKEAIYDGNLSLKDAKALRILAWMAVGATVFTILDFFF